MYRGPLQGWPVRCAEDFIFRNTVLDINLILQLFGGNRGQV